MNTLINAYNAYGKQSVFLVDDSFMHRFETESEFDHKIKQAELSYVLGSIAGKTTLAENYVGLPYEIKQIDSFKHAS